MSGDAFKRVTAGAPMELPATAWNACLDAAEAHRARQVGQDAGSIKQFRQADIVLVKNVSGSDVPRFGVLGISGVVIAPWESLDNFQSQVALKGITPTVADHSGKFVVCLDPLENGVIGRAWVSGVCHVQVEVTDDAHNFCDVRASDSTKLKSSPTGSARILFRESSVTGTTWCVVRLADREPSTIRLGKTTATWPKGTTATINVWESGTAGSEDQTTGVTIPGCVNKFAQVASGKWVIVARGVNGSHYLIAAEC